jgi:ankyrin repeat protein
LIHQLVAALFDLFSKNPTLDINHLFKDGNTALLIACLMSKWSFAKELISNSRLKIGEIEDEMEGTIDLHPIDTDGSTALTLQVLARIKLVKAEQTYNMKKQRVQAVEAKKEYDEVWELIKLMLVREKEQQGHSKADCKYPIKCKK